MLQKYSLRICLGESKLSFLMFKKNHFLFNCRCLPRTPGCARLSLESYVYNILYDVKIPDYGKSIRIYLPPEQPHLQPQPILLQRPKINELPLLDFPLRLLFEYLGVECVIELFTCVLLENQVLLKSEGKWISFIKKGQV